MNYLFSIFSSQKCFFFYENIKTLTASVSATVNQVSFLPTGAQSPVYQLRHLFGRSRAPSLPLPLSYLVSIMLDQGSVKNTPES